MTHEAPLPLLCRRLWPGFTGQLTVNWWFSSPNHLIVSVALRLPRMSLRCWDVLQKPICYHLLFLPVGQHSSRHHVFAICVLGSGKQESPLQTDPWWDDGQHREGHDQSGDVQAEGAAGPGAGEAETGSRFLALQLALRALHLHKLQGSPQTLALRWLCRPQEASLQVMA